MLFLYTLQHFEQLLAAWHDAGAVEVTIIDGVGTRRPSEQAGRNDLPLLPSIRDLLQADDAPRRVILTVVEEDRIDPLIAATERVLGDLREQGNGILVVLPVSRIVGYRY
jgi:hypothetical protein